MKLPVLRFLGRGDPAIPADIFEVLDSAEIMLFHGDEDTGPRPLVCMAGSGLRGAWFHGQAETSARIRRRWPELSEAQIQRCCDFIEARVLRTIRDVSHAEAHARRRNWVMDY